MDDLFTDVSLDLYRIFCAVVQAGNMSLAAKELYISQPAVSMAIRQLEGKLGRRLLIRSSRGIQTTTEGAVLYDYLRQALSLIQTAENKYTEMVNLKSGEIKIGASDTILSHYLLSYIERFMENYPGIAIKATNRTTYETIRLLKSGQVDMSFVNLPIEPDANLEIYPCLDVHDCLIGGHRFAHLAQTGVALKDLSQYPLMLLERESNTRRFLDSFAADNGVVLCPNIELGSSDLLVQFAHINLGLTFAIREFTDIDGVSLVEIPLHPPPPPRQIGFVKLQGVVLSYAAASFASLFAGVQLS